ncbi:MULTISPECIES: ABC transporter substrate-binding protein [Cupriavidus]|uniref:ABC transporter substrate-binding protein n=1 Tax=Cupriavidus TaxID=106589 RepID=UPI0003766C58|nr:MULTISPECIES: ABC transporter substrate-binding protein [Cupriavidus]
MSISSPVSFLRKTALVLLAGAAALSAAPASAQQTQSRLFEITKSRKLPVCIYPLYYAISFRDTKTNALTGLDIDMARELGKELGAEVEFVESGFGTFIADLQSNKCAIGMFALGVTTKRAQAVEFSKPYMNASVYGVVRKGGKVKTWADIDKPGVKVAVLLGSYIETYMKGYLKKATIVSIQPPATREAELSANRADVILVDYPTVLRVKQEFDWAQSVEPPKKLAPTPVAYAIPQGDQIWLNFVNQFIDITKMDGRLAAIARKYQLDGNVAP